ncbi:FmdB family zinc ribbon protein [Legionella sp.]|uniref:FmdB family zinc ribbon protein n=1 Tax=Legionella sp. TaxID=459 RepID=UPI003CA3E843
MPIYEYKCTNCHHLFDLMQKISDEAITQCPQCNKNTVIKLISAAGFQLKGTGWYATDFKNKSNISGETAAKNDDTTKKTDCDKKSSTESSSTSSD